MPICRALSSQGIAIAPRTYWARRSRPPSRRALKDAALTEILAGIYEPDENGRRPPECLYGSVKMREHLNRQGITAAKCTVERLMRARGWRGVTRARTVRTTIPDPGHTRASALSAAELRLLPMLATHLSFPEIAAELFLSRHTVKSEAVSIYRKLGVSSRAQAVIRCRELGLLPG